MTESQQSQTEKGLPPEGACPKQMGEAVVKNCGIHSGLGAMEFFNRLLDLLFQSYRYRSVTAHHPGLGGVQSSRESLFASFDPAASRQDDQTTNCQAGRKPKEAQNTEILYE